MKQFRLVAMQIFKHSLFNKEGLYIGKWFNCKDFTIEDVKRFEHHNNECIEDGQIKCWFYEYREVEKEA